MVERNGKMDLEGVRGDGAGSDHSAMERECRGAWDGIVEDCANCEGRASPIHPIDWRFLDWM